MEPFAPLMRFGGPRIAVVIFLVVVSEAAYSQSEKTATEYQPRTLSLNLGGKDIWIGMPKSSALSALGECCRLLKLKEDSWSVYKQASDFGYGTVEFRNDRVAYVDRSWATEGVGELESVYGVLSRLYTEGFNHCSLSVSETREPTSEVRVARIDCGRKVAVITLATFQEKNGSKKIYDVSEGLQ